MEQNDIASLYSEIESQLTVSSKEIGRYLTWTYIRDDTANVIKYLCEQRGAVETSIVRQLLIAVLQKKIEALPDGHERVLDSIGRTRVEVTQHEFRERKLEQLERSRKTTNNGPNISRLLGNNSSRDWLRKHHGITFSDGQWTIITQDNQS